MKTLNTLREVPTSERARLLTRLTAYFLPSPLVDPSQLKLPTVSPESEVLGEVLNKLRLDRDSLTPADRPSILEELYKQFMANALTDERSEAARQRLGMFGELRLDFYDIKYRDSFSLFEDLGTRRSHVEAAIRTPDAFEHLLPARLQSGEAPLVSLFLKHMSVKGHDPFFLLVETRRNNDVLVVSDSWRIYTPEVPLPERRTPIELLRSFVSVYGVPFSVGGHMETLFVLHDAFPMEPESQRQGNQVHKVMRFSKPLTHMRISSHVRISELNVVEIAIAYAIDLNRYIDTLRRHNVSLSLEIK